MDYSPLGSLSIGISRQEYWKIPVSRSCHALLQGIFPSQRSKVNLTSPALANRLITTSATWENPYSPRKVKVQVAESYLTLCHPWTVVCQTTLSLELSRQEYWSGLPFPSPGDSPSQGFNPGLPHCRQILYQLSYQGNLLTMGWPQIWKPWTKNIIEDRKMLSLLSRNYVTLNQTPPDSSLRGVWQLFV